MVLWSLRTSLSGGAQGSGFWRKAAEIGVFLGFLSCGAPLCCAPLVLGADMSLVVQMILALLFCAVALAAVAKEPAPAPRKDKHDPNRWAHLPSGGGGSSVFFFFAPFVTLATGDYSLGANYGPLFKGKVGGAAQDVDNDNNNNGALECVLLAVVWSDWGPNRQQ